MMNSVRTVQRIFGPPPAGDGRPVTVLAPRRRGPTTLSIGLFELRWRCSARPIVVNITYLQDSIYPLRDTIY